MRDADLEPSRRLLAAIVCAACLVVAALAAGRIQAELTRGPTASEWARASAVELASRWRQRPVGKIFPASIPYNPDLGGDETARLVGIGPTADCASALDERLAALLSPLGCQGALRATYLDQTQGLVITVALVAFADAGTAARALKAVPTEGRPTPGIRALGFPGSVAARFTDRTRQATSFRQRGPYLAVTSTGYTDGRTGRAKQKQTDLYTVAPQLAERILTQVTAPAARSCEAVEYQC